MSDLLTGKVWNLDSALGVVTTGPVCVHSIRVSFTTAANGFFAMTSFSSNTTFSSAEQILRYATVTTSTAVTDSLWDTTKEFLFNDQTFLGLTKTLCNNVRLVQVVIR